MGVPARNSSARIASSVIKTAPAHSYPVAQSRAWIGLPRYAVWANAVGNRPAHGQGPRRRRSSGLPPVERLGIHRTTHHCEPPGRVLPSCALSASTPGSSSANLPAPSRPPETTHSRHQLEELAARLAEERDRLRTSEQQLQAIIDTSPECVKLVARDGTLLHMNPSGLAMVEAESCDLVTGRNLYDVIAPEHRARFREFNERVCSGEKGVLEFDIIGLRGTRRHMETHAAPLRLNDGRIVQLALTRDITGRKHSDAALSELAQRVERERRTYDAILSATPDLVYTFDLQHRFTYANQALLKLWGRTWEEAIGRTCRELDYPEWQAERHDREIDQVIATKEPVRGEVPFTGTNGRRIYDYIFVPVFGANGEVEAVAGTTRDITERQRKEQQLRFLVDLNAATQSLSDPGEIMRASARLLGEHLGVDRCAYAEVKDQSVFVITGDYLRNVPSIVGEWPVAAFGPDCTSAMLTNRSYVVTDSEDDPRIGPADIAAYRATRIRGVICVPLHKSGQFTAAMAVHQSTPRVWAPDEIELVELVVARCWESLERARTLRQLQASEQRLRFMAESMPQKIFTAGANGAIDYVNPQWIEFTGATREELLRWNWLRHVHQDDRDENLCRWNESLRTGQPLEFEHRFRRHDGTYRWHLTRADPMRDAFGEVVMWIGSSTDIEEQKRAEEKLEQVVVERTAQLRETIGELEGFSYSIAHDLRAPLRSLQGYADLLLTDHAGGLAPEAQEFLRRISSASSRMDRLVQDVLNYSRVMRTDLKFTPVPLGPLVQSIVETYPLFASDRATVEIRGELPVVLGNEAMLTQVFSNLLGNAVKFVAPGVKPHVRVWAEVAAGRATVFVADNGIGIAPDQQARIFELFQQVDKTYGGTGIGLAIVKKAVERLNGRLGLTSTAGEGSTFWIELPSAPASA